MGRVIGGMLFGTFWCLKHASGSERLNCKANINRHNLRSGRDFEWPAFC